MLTSTQPNDMSIRKAMQNGMWYMCMDFPEDKVEDEEGEMPVNIWWEIQNAIA